MHFFINHRLAIIHLVGWLSVALLDTHVAEAQNRDRFRRTVPGENVSGPNPTAAPATGANERRARLRNSPSPDANDPTQPSARIRQQLDTSGSPNIMRQEVRPTTMNMRSNLPEVPLIVVRSRVMSSADQGVVTLAANGDSVRVQLEKSENIQTAPHQFPAIQFAKYVDALKQLTAPLVQLAGESMLGEVAEVDDQKTSFVNPAAMQSTSPINLPSNFRLDKTFTLAGITYRIVDFDQRTVLLEALPLGQLVLVR